MMWYSCQNENKRSHVHFHKQLLATKPEDNSIFDVKFESFTAMKIQVEVFWFVTPLVLRQDKTTWRQKPKYFKFYMSFIGL
jgi:hypothetical protein